MGVGFSLALLSLGGVREVLGSGSLFGIPLFGESFQPWVVMILPSGGFFALAGLVLLGHGFGRGSARTQPGVEEAE